MGERAHAMHGFLSQRYKFTTGSAPIEATAPSAMACFRKFAGLAILALPSAIDAGKALTCPSSSVYCGLEQDAAGTTQFVKHDMPEPDKCVNVASGLPEGGQGRALAQESAGAAASRDAVTEDVAGITMGTHGHTRRSRS